jgi:energy-coupling factor transporter ATP-binding protein EcfA2
MDDNIARLAELQEKEDGAERRPKQADVLIALANAAVLFHSPAPDCDAFADITVHGHRETHRIRGRAFRQWLRHQYFKKTKNGANSDALQVATETIAARATFEGDEHEVHCRIAGHGGAIYIDIGDSDWKAIRVTNAGWDIIADFPVRFQRAPSMRPLPIPVRGGSIELLRSFCNVSESGFTLFVAVLLAGLRPQSNYPVAVLTGEQGTGKSSLVRILARLIDPRMPEQRSTPRTEEDLLVAAGGQHFLSFDNVSGLPDWLSDAICRLSTGGGAGKRQLYTDTDEILFSGRRLVAINGIEDVAVRPDLVDRAVMLALEPIAEKRRRDEAEYNAEFARIAPRVLGALLDGVVTGLRDLAATHIADKPRMADFALWAEACTRAYWPAGTFLAAYRANLAASVDLVLEASPVGEAVQLFMADRTAWEGTASALLPLLTGVVTEQAAREKSWPKRADVLSGKLRRVAPALRRTGIHVAFDRSGHTRTIHIEARAAPEQQCKTASQVSQVSPSGRNPSKSNGQGRDANDAVMTPRDAAMTPAFEGGVIANSLETHANDGSDANDAVLHPQSGNGPTSDFDAVLEELAAQGELKLTPLG